MPRKMKKSKKKTYKKKQTKSRVTKNQTMVKFGLGFPKQACVTHKYNEIIQMTSTLGSVTSHGFRANGMFDPNFAIGGHQPLYFDQFTSIYNHYTVIGAKITARVMQATSTGVPMTIAVFQDDDGSLSTLQMVTIKEQNSARWLQIAAADNNIHTLSCTFSVKKTFGGSVLANNKIQGQNTVNPVDEAMFFFVTQCTDATSTNSLVLDVSIEYIAVWSEVKDVLGS